MTLKQNICVIGCGWLGFPLAKSLVNKGYIVKGTTTSLEKVSKLKSNNIDGFLVQFSSEGITGSIEKCLSDCDTVILNIPPGLRKNPEANYVKQMQNFIPFLEASTVKNIVLVSSTSVYDDDESFPVITETFPTSNKSNQLITVETMFQTNSNFNTTILRFSGLFNEDRHPASFLSGKQNIKNPKAPVNLIHRKDCIAIIESVLEQNIWNETFNIATTPHPTKQSYYTSICKTKNLALPCFDDTQISQGKIIDSSKLIHVLNYEFQIKL